MEEKAHDEQGRRPGSTLSLFSDWLNPFQVLGQAPSDMIPPSSTFPALVLLLLLAHVPNFASGFSAVPPPCSRVQFPQWSPFMQPQQQQCLHAASSDADAGSGSDEQPKQKEKKKSRKNKKRKAKKEAAAAATAEEEATSKQEEEKEKTPKAEKPSTDKSAAEKADTVVDSTGDVKEAAKTATSSMINTDDDKDSKRKVVIIGAGWGGLSTAHTLSKDASVEVTLVEASPRVGGLVRDGFTTTSGQRAAEAGQHGFWNNYHNIYRLLEEDIPGLSIETALTDFAEQGQYSPNGLEAVWPIYRDQPFELPTGLAQAAFTRFLKLPLLDRITAFPLVLAFSEFDDSVEAWERYDSISFRDLCMRLGVSRRCYEEAFEPMILTGLFAPGAECSAAAALGMAYFFVLQSQKAFDVQWCRGNIGQVIFDPWVKTIAEAGVHFQTSTQVTGFELDAGTKRITHVKAKTTSNGKDSKKDILLEADEVVFAVGAKALSTFVQYCPELAQFPDLAKFANLRGTSVLATRVFLDRDVDIPYTANACWGFDEGVGMTVFDIKGLHGVDASTVADAPGAVIEVDYYHASNLLVMNDEDIVAKVKRDLDSILVGSLSAKVVDAAVVRLPQGVNWYYPGSYQNMPDANSKSLHNLHFAGDIVRSRHGSWSQEKAFVTGVEAANAILGKPTSDSILPVAADELHVQFGKRMVNLAKKVLGRGDPWKGPSLADFFW